MRGLKPPQEKIVYVLELVNCDIKCQNFIYIQKSLLRDLVLILSVGSENFNLFHSCI